jgi:ElaB/YqjD/DUF883 family membrane-anchored ribosome-binding protein
MVRSVDDLRRESERNRAELAATVERLKACLAGTADDIRQTASPQHIKSEVSDYVGRQARSWIDSIKERAIEHPLQTVAAGTAVAVPLLRLARGISPPVMMIAAGLALTSKTVRERVDEAAAPVGDKAGGLLESAREIQRNVVQATSSAKHTFEGTIDETRSAAAGVAEGLQGRAEQAYDTLSENAASSVDMAHDAMSRLRDAAKRGVDGTKEAVGSSSAGAREALRNNVAVLGGVGAVLGIIVAAALPATRAESKIMGGPREKLKEAARDAAASSVDAGKNVVLSAVDAAVQSVAEADLGRHASRMTEGAADRLREAADDVVAAALESSPNAHEARNERSKSEPRQ